MKLNLTGFLFELDKINFRAGSFLVINFTLEDGHVIQERVRSIKHYDRFFRTPPKKRKPGDPSEPEPQPKRLIEAHFVQLKEENRRALTKFLMTVTMNELKKRK